LFVEITEIKKYLFFWEWGTEIRKIWWV